MLPYCDLPIFDLLEQTDGFSLYNTSRWDILPREQKAKTPSDRKYTTVTGRFIASQGQEQHRKHDRKRLPLKFSNFDIDGIFENHTVRW